jgi:SAM-dependent methyltransferase
MARQPKHKVLLHRLLWQIDLPIDYQYLDGTHVDLGAGNNPRNPFNAATLIATDFHEGFIRHDGVKFVKADLTDKLPFADDSISSMSAYDVLEHIPRWERLEGNIQFPFINLMNEISRCLVPGGIFLAVTPVFPQESAFQDPTHINIMTKNSILYFAGREPWAKSLGYGYTGDFNIIINDWLRGGAVFSTTKLSPLKNQGFVKKTLVILKLTRKILLMKRAKECDHLLWVLQKNTP